MMTISKYKVESLVGMEYTPGTRQRVFMYRCKSLITGRRVTFGWYEKRQIGSVFKTTIPLDMA